VNDDLCLTTSVDDIHKAKKEGKIAIVLGFQDTKPIEDDV